MAVLALAAEARLIAVVLAPDPVALIAGRRCAGELSVQVTRLARDRLVPTFEPERRGIVERTIGRAELRQSDARPEDAAVTGETGDKQQESGKQKSVRFHGR